VQEAAWRKQQEEEARKKAEAEAAALESKKERDQRKAEETVAEIKHEYANWQKGGAKHEPGRWKMLPAVGGLPQLLSS
jgi:hypothetical protein